MCRVCLHFAALFLLGSIANAETFYVAPAGDNAWSGTLASANSAHADGPWATLMGARDRLRALRADGKLKGPVEIIVAGGNMVVLGESSNRLINATSIS